MSVADGIARIQTGRNTIRAKLVELGMAQNTDSLDKLAAAVEAVENRGAVSVIPTATTPVRNIKKRCVLRRNNITKIVINAKIGGISNKIPISRKTSSKCAHSIFFAGSVSIPRKFTTPSLVKHHISSSIPVIESFPPCNALLISF